MKWIYSMLSLIPPGSFLEWAIPFSVCLLIGVGLISWALSMESSGFREDWELVQRAQRLEREADQRQHDEGVRRDMESMHRLQPLEYREMRNQQRARIDQHFATMLGTQQPTVDPEPEGPRTTINRGRVTLEEE